MKRALSVLLLLSLLLSLVSCNRRQEEVTGVSCEDIIRAYEDAGYTLGHHLHEDPVYLQEGICCSLMFEAPADPDNNYIYVERYASWEEALAANKDNQYNPVLWFVFGVYGEWRWLRTGRFGEICYMTHDRKLIRPLRETVK